MEYKNGTLWQKDGTVALLQYLTDEVVCLFEVGETLKVIADPDHPGKWQYHFEEIPERLKGWEPVSGTIGMYSSQLHASTHATSGGGIETDAAAGFRAEKAKAEAEVLETVKKKVKKGRV